MEIYNILTGVELDTFNIIRKFLIDEFRDIDLDKLFKMLTTLDDLHIDYLRKKVYFDKSFITTLRDEIYNLYEQKMFENDDK